VESANNKKRKKRIQKRGKKEGKKREDTCSIADEQPSTPGVPDSRKVLGYRNP
jgi:hypothetical protein